MVVKILSIAVLSSLLCQSAYSEAVETSSKVQYFESFSEESTKVLFLENMNQALNRVNSESEGFTVSIEGNFHPNFLLKVAFLDGREMSIDMVTPWDWTNDAMSMKDISSFAEEIKTGIDLHLQASQIEGILVSSSGSKFDIRGLKKHSCLIDSEGYLVIDGHRVKSSSKVFKARNIGSYGVMRLVEDGDVIYFTDKEASLWPDRVGLQITCQLETFEGQEYYSLTKPVLNDRWQERMLFLMQGWPAP